MISSPAAPLLRRLADTRHHSVPPADMDGMCREVIAELENTAAALDAALGAS